MESPRPTRSRTIYRNLRVVFAGEPIDLAAAVLTLCVLFEDLRLELSELSESKVQRNVYLIRRSIATLREFADCLRHIDGLGSFAPIKGRFSIKQRGIWSSSVAFISANKS
jgi:hypothetical protein